MSKTIWLYIVTSSGISVDEITMIDQKLPGQLIGIISNEKSDTYRIYFYSIDNPTETFLSCIQYNSIQTNHLDKEEQIKEVINELAALKEIIV